MMSDYIRTELEIDDQETIDEFIESYLSLYEEILPQMRASCAVQNFQELRTQAHTLKGSSANIGAEPVRETSLRLQEAADAKNNALCELLVGELEKQINLVR